MAVFIRIPVSVIKAGNYKVGLTPREDFQKTAVSLPELVQQTNAFSTKYREGCTPKLEKSNPKELSLQYRVTCHKADSDPKGHQVLVKFDVSKIAEKQNANDLDVQCSCSCPAFLYWGAQWNLHQRDGLLGEPRPLLQAPTERLDLRSNYVICKHCKAVFERILPSVQHNINNITREREVKKREEELKGQPPPSIRRQPKTPAEDVQELEEAEKEKMLEQEGIVERDEPSTNEEKLKHPPQKKPRWRETIDKLKERVKGWTGFGEKAPNVPTPEPKKETPPEKTEDRKIQEDLLREERKRLKGPTFKEHTPKPHVDEGLPYEPRWKKLVKNLKNRVKQWGTK